MDQQKENGNSKEEKAKKDSLTKKGKRKRSFWIPKIFLLSILISAIFSVASNYVLDGAGYVIAFLLLAAFIFVGILFDIIGVAATVADEKPFHSMAAHREPCAADALFLIRNAERVSSVCNDVVGDISGIVSGSTAAIIVAKLCVAFNLPNFLLSVGISALVSGLTIGGKAIGKAIAINNSTKVIHSVAKFIHIFRRKAS